MAYTDEEIEGPDLSVLPAEVEEGGEVTIPVDVRNAGEEKDSHIDDLKDTSIPLGTINSGEKITAVTSYHMDEETENWTQSDTMTFDIETTREEEKSTCRPRALPHALDPEDTKTYLEDEGLRAHVVNMATRPAYYRARNTGPWPRWNLFNGLNIYYSSLRNF